MTANKISSLMKIRRGMLMFSVIGTFLIGIRHLLPGEAGSGGSFDAFCPFGAIETMWKYVTTRQTLVSTNLLNFSILGGTLAVSLVAGRAFCGWMCPLGGMQDKFGQLGRWLAGEKRHIRGKPGKFRLPLRLSDRVDRPLRYAKYLILALIILASAFAVYPPLYQFCPVRAVFSFRLTRGLLWSVLAIFIITSLILERVWCKYLCPLGAVLTIFNKISPIRLHADFDSCNHCGRCDIDCSMGIKDVPDHLSDPECIRCLECLETCSHEDALTLHVL